MEAFILEFLIRSTLIAFATQIVLWLLRVRSAAARHNAWTWVVVAMLFLPVWSVWGPKASISIRAASTMQPSAPATFAEPNLGPAASPPIAELPPQTDQARHPAAWDWQTIAVGVYLLGALIFLLRLALGTLRARRLGQAAHMQNDRLTSGACISPVTVGWFRPSTILPASWPDWHDSKLNAVLAHEREHVRRRDPLFQWLALLNRAVFWFHPLSWWLERHLAMLAEEACDAAALDCGYSPQDYCTYLLDIADSVSTSGTRLKLAGMYMPGGSLAPRIRKILSGLPGTKLSRARIASVIAACVISTALLAATRFENAAFEVATIKPTTPGYDGGKFTVMQSTRHYVVRNYSVKDMIGAAYDLPVRLISGGPDWVTSGRYDIDALTPGNARPTPDQQMAMLRTLLANRFKLEVHQEEKELPVYVLSVGKDGHKLQESAAGTDEFLINRMFNNNRVLLPARYMTMKQFASELTQAIVDRPVVDKTGLPGHYNFDLDWTRDETQFGGKIPMANVEPGTPQKPDLFYAIRQQLGLQLQATRGPVQVVVIDRVSRPTPN